jgi:hypothetical protein
MRKYTDQELGRAAGRIFTEGRANPINWHVRTPLGTFGTTDRSTCHTQSGEWTAELRRSKNGRHMFLAVFKGGAYRGRYDSSGWHSATERSRIRHLRSYQLPLVA